MQAQQEKQVSEPGSILSSLEDRLKAAAHTMVMLTAEIVELQRVVLALASALTNQSTLDRPRLAQEFLTMYRLASGTQGRPKGVGAAVMTTLQSPK